MQGGEYHASPPVGLQALLVALLVVVSLFEGSGADEEEETGDVPTGLSCATNGAGEAEETAEDVMTGEEVSAAAAVVVIGAAGRCSCCFPASPAQEW